MKFFILFVLSLESINIAQGSICASQFKAFGSFQEFRQGSDPTTLYMNLIRHLALGKNAISSEDLLALSKMNAPANPMLFLSDSLSAEEKFSFSQAFQKIKSVDWNKAKEQIRELISVLEKRHDNQTEANKETKRIFFPKLKNVIFYENHTTGYGPVFTLHDGTSMAVISGQFRDDEFFYLTDLNKGEKIPIDPTHFKTGYPRIINVYRTKSGKDWVASNSESGGVRIFEVTPQHQIRMLNRLKLPPFTNGKYNFIQSGKLSENDQGDPIFTFPILASAVWPKGPPPALGFVSVDALTGKQKIIPVPHIPWRPWKIRKSQQNVLLSNGTPYSFVIDSNIVEATNLFTGEIKQIKYPKGQLTQAIVNTDDPSGLIFSGVFGRWLHLSTGEFVDVTSQLNELKHPLGLVSTPNGWQIINPTEYIDSIVVYNPLTKKIDGYSIKPDNYKIFKPINYENNTVIVFLESHPNKLVAFSNVMGPRTIDLKNFFNYGSLLGFFEGADKSINAVINGYGAHAFDRFNILQIIGPLQDGDQSP